MKRRTLLSLAAASPLLAVKSAAASSSDRQPVTPSHPHEHLTRWRPDTCGCVLVFAWDDRDPPDTRRHTLREAEHVCRAHQGAFDAFDVCLTENRRKNVAVNLAMQAAPEMGDVAWSLLPGPQGMAREVRIDLGAWPPAAADRVRAALAPVTGAHA